MMTATRTSPKFSPSMSSGYPRLMGDDEAGRSNPHQPAAG
jgi:hypothetical protein